MCKEEILNDKGQMLTFYFHTLLVDPICLTHYNSDFGASIHIYSIAGNYEM